MEEYPKCSDCGSTRLSYKPCADCPLTHLAKRRFGSVAESLMNSALTFEFATKHLNVDWEDVTQEQAICFRILDDERAKYQIDSRPKQL